MMRIFIYILVCLVLTPGLAIAEPSPYIVDGDKVYIDDEYVRLSQEPHTLGFDGKAIIKLESKVFEGYVDLVFGFNTTQVRPGSARLYNPSWVPVERSYTCMYEYNFTVDPLYLWCYYNTSQNTGSNASPSWVNQTVVVWEGGFETADLDTDTVYWTGFIYTPYKDFSDRFTKIRYDYGGMDTWYYSEGLWVNRDQEYELSIDVDYIYKVGESSGKYWVCLKPSSKGLAEAESDGSLYCLDPWWNTSWGFHVNSTQFNFNGTDNLVNMPFVLNGSFGWDTASLLSDSKIQVDCDDIRAIFPNNTESVYHFENRTDSTFGCNSTSTFVWVLADSILAANTSNMSVFYGNPDAPAGRSSTPPDSFWVGMWHMDKINGLVDHTGNLLNASLNTSASVVDGGIGRAVDYGAGSTHQIEDDALMDGTAEVSVFVCAKRDALTGGTTANMASKEAPSDYSYMMRLNSGTDRTWHVKGASAEASVTSGAWPDNTNYHSMVGTYNSSFVTANQRLYFDGVLLAAGNLNGGAVFNSGSNFTISGRHDGSRPFNGRVSEVWLWTREASPAEVSHFDALCRGRNFTSILGAEQVLAPNATQWNYSLDGAANVSFFPNITINVGRGQHQLEIFSNVSTNIVFIDNPGNTTVFSDTVDINISINETGGDGFNETFFSVGGILVTVRDQETEANISSGINVRILNLDETINASDTTNGSGASLFFGIPFGTYKVQAGGPAGSAYPHILTYTFSFTEFITNLDVFLAEATSCQFVTYQYVDSFFQTPLEDVSVTFFKTGSILTETTTDTNGFITICLVPGLLYTLQSVKNGYQSTNFTDRATLSSQFVQMIKDELSTVTETSITLNPYPLETTFFINDTLFLGMFISDTESQLTDYGVVYGRSEDVIRDNNVDSDQPLFKLEVAEGSLSGGEFIDCLPDNCLDAADWEDGRVFVGYHYTRSGSSRVWLIREIRIDRNSPQSENFLTGYLFQNDPRDALFAFFASIGYPRDADRPSLGMVTFSLFVMAASAGSAARRGGILFAMIAMMVANIILALMGLIQWWSIIISFSFIGFLANKFGGQFT